MYILQCQKCKKWFPFEDVAPGVLCENCAGSHIESHECWCEPFLEYEDPETGNQVWVHRMME